MKKLIFFLLWIVFSQNFYCQEITSKTWKPAEEPKTYEEAHDLYKKTLTEQQEAEDKLKDSKISEKEKEEVRLKLAQTKYDLATAQKSMIESDWNAAQKELSLTGDKLSNLNKKETDQRQAQNDILEKTQNLTQALAKRITIVESTARLKEKFDNSVEQLNQYQTLRRAWPDKAYTLDDQILKLLNSLNESIQIRALEKEINLKKINQEKVDTIHDYNEQSLRLRSLVEDELKQAKDASKKITYKQILADIDTKRFDTEIIFSKIYGEKPVERGWFGRIIDTITGWFGYKKLIQEPITPENLVINELSLLKKHKDEFKKTAQLLTDIEELQKNIGLLSAKAMEAYRVRDTNQLNTLKKELDALQKLHTNFTEQISSNKLKEQYEKMNDIYTGVRKVEADLDAKSDRARRSFRSLFDAMLRGYSPLMDDINNQNFYEFFGLQPYATIQEVHTAYTKIEDDPTISNKEKTKAEQIYNELANPLRKLNYDTFLQDYNALMKKGLTHDEIKNPDKKQSIEDFLNKDGSLVKIEMRKKDADEIRLILSQVNINQLKYDIIDAADDFQDEDQIGERLDEVQKVLENTSKLIEEGLKPQKTPVKELSNREQAIEIRKTLPETIETALQNAILPNIETDDYYEILGIGTDADDRTLARANRQLLAKYHPDKVLQKVSGALNVYPEKEKQDYSDKVKTWATLITYTVQEAYNVLSDYATRLQYDKSRKRKP